MIVRLERFRFEANSGLKDTTFASNYTIVTEQVSPVGPFYPILAETTN